MQWNVEQKKGKHINFKRHKPDHIHPGSSAPDPLSVSSTEAPPKLFKDHSEFKTYVSSSVMAPLFNLQTDGLLQLCYRLDVENNESSQSQCDLQIPHTEHGPALTCKKCLTFYETYIQLSPAQVEKLTEETQSASQLWHDARKLRLTASTAKRAPKRSTTNPQKFLNEHLHPTFTGNTATKYGKENEDIAIQLMEAHGHTGGKAWWCALTVPDGVLDSTQLLEIKCPLKSAMSLAEFLSRPNGDIRCLSHPSQWAKWTLPPGGWRFFFFFKI